MMILALGGCGTEGKTTVRDLRKSEGVSYLFIGSPGPDRNRSDRSPGKHGFPETHRADMVQNGADSGGLASSRVCVPGLCP